MIPFEKKHLSFVIVFLFIVVVVFALQFRFPLSLYPLNESPFALWEVGSDSAGVNVLKEFDSNHGHEHGSYLLESEKSAVKLIYHTHELARTVDISNYTYLELATAEWETKPLTVVLYFYLPGFSDPADMATHRPLAFHCYPKGKRSCFRLPIEEFATPVKWFSMMKTREEQLPEVAWDKLSHIAIIGHDMDSSQPLKLSLMQFTDSVGAPLWWVAILCSLWIGLVWLSKRVIPLRSKVVVRSEQQSRVIAHIQEKYGEKDLTLNGVADELQLSTNQISQIIRSEFSMGYKQYLNSLRIAEAKRLLSSTDLPIALIGERVGYPYANSFSRTFRSAVGVTPNEYRRSVKEGSN